MMQLYPEEAEGFDDVWKAMLPIIKKLQAVGPRRRCSTIAGLLATAGLGFGDTRNRAKQVVLWATAATVMTMQDAQREYRSSEVRELLSKNAARFGGHKDLQTLLERIALPFCLRLYRDTDWDEREGDKDTDAKTADAVREKPPAKPEAVGSEDDYYCVIWSQKGRGDIKESEYTKEYAQPPSTGGPLVWIDLISGHSSVRLHRTRTPVRVSGQKLKLLCLFLRNFGLKVSTDEFQSINMDHSNVLYALHNATHHVLRPFLDVTRGEGRTLMRHATDDRRKKFSFYLIERYRETEHQP
ncbi:MAG: hypothetical protein ACTSYX_10155 [Candidatus Thorarchaeota archaeon]